MLADRSGVKLPKMEYSKRQRRRRTARRRFWRSISWQPIIFIISSSSRRER